MAVAEAVAPRFEMGRVIKRTFSVVPNNIGSFTVLSLVPGLSSAVMDWGGNQFEAAALQGTVPDGATLALLGAAVLVYFVSWFILQAAVVYGAIASANGRRASLGDCLEVGFRFFGRLMLIGLLATLGILGGAVLLIVPGIMFALMWFVVVPVCVVEHTSVTGAFGRSRELTSGYRWPIFFVCLVYFIVALIVLFTVGALIGVVLLLTTTVLTDAGSGTVIQVVANVAGTMISSVFLSTLIASIYHELRQIKEGVGPESLASVFD